MVADLRGPLLLLDLLRDLERLVADRRAGPEVEDGVPRERGRRPRRLAHRDQRARRLGVEAGEVARRRPPYGAEHASRGDVDDVERPAAGVDDEPRPVVGEAQVADRLRAAAEDADLS